MGTMYAKIGDRETFGYIAETVHAESEIDIGKRGRIMGTQYEQSVTDRERSGHVHADIEFQR